MSRETEGDNLRHPVGLPMDNNGAKGTDEGEVREGDNEEVEKIDEQISDDPSYGEDEAEYDPAT